jgi:hypothetical protein
MTAGLAPSETVHLIRALDPSDVLIDSSRGMSILLT